MNPPKKRGMRKGQKVVNWQERVGVERPMSVAKKVRLLLLLDYGQKLFDALDICKVGYQAYRREREIDPSFAEDVNIARAKHYKDNHSRGEYAGSRIKTGYPERR